MTAIVGLSAVIASVVAVFVALGTAALWRWVAPRLDRAALHGRTAELRATLLAPLLAMAVVPALCLAPSLVAALAPAFDHCLAHTDHLVHLCFTHLPTAPLTALAVAAVAIVAVSFMVVGHGAAAGVRAQRVSSRIGSLEATALGDVLLLATPRCIAFTLGLWRPRIFASAGLRARLSADAWSVVLAHERAHVRRRDPLWSLTVRAASRLHLPWVRRRLLALHDLAVERACDETAVQHHAGDRVVVAETLLTLERLAMETPAGACGVAGTHLAVRVRALLAERHEGRRPLGLATRIGSAAVTLVVMAVAATPLHDAAEHLLEAWFY